MASLATSRFVPTHTHLFRRFIMWLYDAVADQVYDLAESGFKVNDMVEFVGVLSVDPSMADFSDG